MRPGDQKRSNVLHDIYRSGILADLKMGGIVAKIDDHDDFHCDDGPAIITDEGEGLMWYNHGLLHRTDGPATMMSWATEWWLNGESITCWNHYQEITGCSSEHLTALKLKWPEPIQDR